MGEGVWAVYTRECQLGGWECRDSVVGFGDLWAVLDV